MSAKNLGAMRTILDSRIEPNLQSRVRECFEDKALGRAALKYALYTVICKTVCAVQSDGAWIENKKAAEFCGKALRFLEPVGVLQECFNSESTHTQSCDQLATLWVDAMCDVKNTCAHISITDWVRLAFSDTLRNDFATKTHADLEKMLQNARHTVDFASKRSAMSALAHEWLAKTGRKEQTRELWRFLHTLDVGEWTELLEKTSLYIPCMADVCFIGACIASMLSPAERLNADIIDALRRCRLEQCESLHAIRERALRRSCNRQRVQSVFSVAQKRDASATGSTSSFSVKRIRKI